MYDNLVLAVILTPLVYMTVPLICLAINHGKFEKKRARRIALWNSIVLGAIFFILTSAISDGLVTWNAAPAFFYYWINTAILKKKNTDKSASSTKELILDSDNSGESSMQEMQDEPEVMATRETATVYLNEQIETKVDSYHPAEQQEQKESLEEQSNDNVKKHICASKKVKQVKVKYCSRCGSKIDSDTKKCTGCGKQYFRGFKFTKLSIALIALAIVSTVCVVQHNEIQYLSDWQSDNLFKVIFFDSHAEIVGDDGTKVYHKYGCSKLDRSNGFWIYNTEAAESKGYTKCTLCH